MIVLTFASKIIIRLLTERIFGQAKFEDVFISYISITIFLSAVFLFLFCLNIKISDAASKPIYFLAPVSLGVYLIHVHPLVFEFLLKDAFASFANKPLAIMVLYVLVAALLIFAVCTTIELLRIQIFKLIKVSKLSDFIARKINNFYLKVLK